MDKRSLLPLFQPITAGVVADTLSTFGTIGVVRKDLQAAPTAHFGQFFERRGQRYYAVSVAFQKSVAVIIGGSLLRTAELGPYQAAKNSRRLRLR